MDSSEGNALLNSTIRTMFRMGTFSMGVVAILGIVLYVKQESLLYFPEIGGIPRRPGDNPRGYRSPEERQIPFESLMIPCEDGVNIHSWLLLRTSDGRNVVPNTPTIVFFHGNAGNIGLRLPNAIQMLQTLNANIMLVEYRGYGNSDSVTPTEAGLRLDAEAALRFIAKHPLIDHTRIFLFGRSLGGAVAFHLAEYAQRQQIPLAGVMVENTFLSISHMVDHLMPYLSPIKAFVLKIGWNSAKIVPHLTTPILYLAGSADQLVPHPHMLQLCKLSLRSVLVQLHVIENGTHNETWVQGGQAYWDKMRSFMVQAIEHASPASNPTNIRRDDAATDASERSATVGFGTDATTCATTAGAIPTMPSSFLNIAQEAVRGKSGTTTTTTTTTYASSKKDI
jgi:pimeloyl-ACP methyl ester carboxylesterase